MARAPEVDPGPFSAVGPVSLQWRKLTDLFVTQVSRDKLEFIVKLFQSLEIFATAEAH